MDTPKKERGNSSLVDMFGIRSVDTRAAVKEGMEGYKEGQKENKKNKENKKVIGEKILIAPMEGKR